MAKAHSAAWRECFYLGSACRVPATGLSALEVGPQRCFRKSLWCNSCHQSHRVRRESGVQGGLRLGPGSGRARIPASFRVCCVTGKSYTAPQELSSVVRILHVAESWESSRRTGHSVCHLWPCLDVEKDGGRLHCTGINVISVFMEATSRRIDSHAWQIVEQIIKDVVCESERERGRFTERWIDCLIITLILKW